MTKKRREFEYSMISDDAYNQSNEEADQLLQDQPHDPLFVPHIENLGVAAERMAAGEDIYADLLESICGVLDDSQAVEQYDGTLGVTTNFVAAHQLSACQVQWNNNLADIFTNPGDVSGVRWGSGTMVTNDLLLTCGHLFDQTGGGWQRPLQNDTNDIIPPEEIALNMRVNFNFQVDPAGNPRPEQSFPITELIEYRLGGIDMAMCRIGGHPGVTFGRTRLSNTDAAVDDMICIIGHPAGLMKRIEAGPTTSISGNLIMYNDIDTLGGNSGSGILSARNGRLVGVHTNGGCNRDGTGSNFGQRIEAVTLVSPTVQGLLRSGTEKLVLYDRSARDGAVLGFNSLGNTNLDTTNSGWRRSWDVIVAGDFLGNGRQQVFLYDRSAGDGAVVGFDNSGSTNLDTTNSGWRRTWDVIVAGDFLGNGRQQVFLYDQSAGDGAVVGFDNSGSTNLDTTNSGWRRTWDVIVAGDFLGNGRYQVLLYDRSARDGAVVGFDNSGSSNLDTTNSGWRRTWDIILPLGLSRLSV